MAAPSGPYAASYQPERLSTAAVTRSYLFCSSIQSQRGSPGRDRHPLEEVGGERAELRQVAEGQAALDGVPQRLPGGFRLTEGARAGQVLALAEVGRDVLPDPGGPRHVEYAARVDEVARGGEGHRGDHGLQVGRPFHRGQPLHRPRVGEAEGSDLARRPRLRGRPLDGVVAVLALVQVRHELAVRSVAPAHVLHHHRVPAGHRSSLPSCSPVARGDGRRACGRRGSGSGRRAPADRPRPGAPCHRAWARARRGPRRRRRERPGAGISFRDTRIGRRGADYAATPYFMKPLRPAPAAQRASFCGSSRARTARAAGDREACVSGRSEAFWYCCWGWSARQ